MFDEFFVKVVILKCRNTLADDALEEIVGQRNLIRLAVIEEIRG